VPRLTVIAQDLRSVVFGRQIFLLNACGWLRVNYVVRLRSHFMNHPRHLNAQQELSNDIPL
jgi:hypothetical protein